jgi:hypothetical protein
MFALLAPKPALFAGVLYGHFHPSVQELGFSLPQTVVRLLRGDSASHQCSPDVTMLIEQLLQTG